MPEVLPVRQEDFITTQNGYDYYYHYPINCKRMTQRFKPLHKVGNMEVVPVDEIGCCIIYIIQEIGQFLHNGSPIQLDTDIFKLIKRDWAFIGVGEDLPRTLAEEYNIEVEEEEEEDEEDGEVCCVSINWYLARAPQLYHIDNKFTHRFKDDIGSNRISKYLVKVPAGEAPHYSDEFQLEELDTIKERNEKIQPLNDKRKELGGEISRIYKIYSEKIYNEFEKMIEKERARWYKYI